jgi:hypothetical protein
MGSCGAFARLKPGCNCWFGRYFLCAGRALHFLVNSPCRGCSPAPRGTGYPFRNELLGLGRRSWLEAHPLLD